MLHAFFINDTFMGNARLTFSKSKQKLRNILRLKFCYFNIILFLHPRYHPKIIEDIMKNVQKTSALVLKTLLTPIMAAEIVECVRACVCEQSLTKSVKFVPVFTRSSQSFFVLSDYS